MEKYLEIILEHLNSKLKENNLVLDKKAVANEYELVNKEWCKVAAKIVRPVKFLIIGEAPLRYSSYFYNPQSTGTTFLNPEHFNCRNKADLRNYFLNQGILVFDLYPFPLPTFIYDNVQFDSNSLEYRNALTNYYRSKLDGLIDVNTAIVLRYSKLASEKKRRGEWGIFETYIGDRECKCIGSNNIPADRGKIKDVFKLR
jgi:hypothetical protein